MLSQIITSFQGLFSRAFWFGSFLPVAIIAALHIALLEVFFPAFLQLRTLLDKGLAQDVTVMTFFIAGLVILAYILTPFAPFVRLLLDGRSLPAWLHDELRADRYAPWKRAKKRDDKIIEDRFYFEKFFDKKYLSVAEAAGIAQKHMHNPAEEKVDKAEKAVEEMRKSIKTIELPTRTLAENAVQSLLAAYGSKDGPVSAKNMRRLDEARGAFHEMLLEAKFEARYRSFQAPAMISREDLLPTRVGDAHWEVERYCQNTYNADYNFLWPRIEMLMQGNTDAFSVRLGDAQSQVHFAALLLGLTLSVPAIWIPVLLWTAVSPWPLLIIGGASVLALMFLYELVVQSEVVFGRAVCAAVDRYRLKVLTDIMHQPPPKTLQAERTLWRSLKAASDPQNPFDLFLAPKD